MADLPWLPLYVDRLLGSRRVRQMDALDFGIYMALLVEEWAEGGPLPDDDEELSVAGKAPIEDVRRILEWCFTLTEDGWANEVLEVIRDEQLEKFRVKSRAGKKGAEMRWKKKKRKPKPTAPEGENGNRIAPLCEGNATAMAIREDKRRGEESRKGKEEPRQTSSHTPVTGGPQTREDVDLKSKIKEFQPLARENILWIHGGTDQPVSIGEHMVGVGIEVDRYKAFASRPGQDPELVARAIRHIPEVTGLERPVSLARWEAEGDGWAVFSQCIGAAAKSLLAEPDDGLSSLKLSA